ncbi:MAG: hypothetical protein ACR2QW_10000 [bacterium]
MKYFTLILCVIALSGCAALMEVSDKAAVKLADAKEKYCEESDENARDNLRKAYNAEMDKRGLPHDQINC